MPATSTISSFIVPANQLKIWLLIPQVESDDPNIQYYYDFSEGLKEFTKVFEDLNADWKWQPVTINNYRKVIDEIAFSANGKLPFIFNLCDGDEVNDVPGISVIHYLQEKGLCFSGSNDYFYKITSSKATMKRAFDFANVPTPKWELIEHKDQNIQGIFERLGSPLIVKPAVSNGGSMGITIKNVVHTEKELQEQLDLMFSGYHGWNLSSGGVVIEQFIKGPEYTTLIVGSSDQPNECIHYLPVERIFHESLPEIERFLSFDRLWEFYENESAMPEQGSFYEYALPDRNLIPALQQLTFNAYEAVKGTGYARLDIRMDAQTKKLYVLEVNAQCGLSESEDHTSIGAILRFSKKSFTQLIAEIIDDGLRKHEFISSSINKKAS
jgi:D-alanine-D-alanine ligase